MRRQSKRFGISYERPSLAQGSVAGLPLHTVMVAVLIAASSNNLLKAIYTITFAGWRVSLPIVGALGLLAAIGFGAAAWVGGIEGFANGTQRRESAIRGEVPSSAYGFEDEAGNPVVKGSFRSLK